jgi:hypothetical protein
LLKSLYEIKETASTENDVPIRVKKNRRIDVLRFKRTLGTYLESIKPFDIISSLAVLEAEADADPELPLSYSFRAF